MFTFNEWRENYDKLTIEEQKDYHNYLEINYPNQAHYDLNFAIKVFDIVNPKKVTEAGGWKGNLADILLKKYNIESWVNIELCENAIKNSVCKDERFKNINPNTFDWWKNSFYDGFFIATHFIEHLSNDHFIQLADSLCACEYIYFEAPITNEGEKWIDFEGTHKLELGWNDIKYILKNHEIIIENQYCKLYKLK